ncbi:MAG: FtsH protease activity modulator HflK [Paracoccaceae bacterium]
MAGQSGGPWGGGGNSGGGRGGDDDRPNGARGNGTEGGGGRRPGEEGQIPEIDELMRKGQEQLRVLMGGRGGNRGNGNGGGTGGPSGPAFTRGTLGLAALVAVVLYGFASFYTVKPEQQGVELLLGKEFRVTDDGPHMAWWPFVTAEVIDTTTERTENIGSQGSGVVKRTSSISSSMRAQTVAEMGLMLTTDANIVDIDFQVVWNISNPTDFLFNIAEPKETVRAVSESVMREIIAASNLAPILNRDRGLIADTAMERIQATLNEYESGINVVRVNLEKADPPLDVIDSFREVQAAEQQRDRLQREADAYANRVLAEARGQSAQTLEEAAAYSARVVNEAEGEASRFSSVFEEYAKAPEVTRRRLYLETMEKVLGSVDKTILDESMTGGQGSGGVVPYLSLNELRRNTQTGGN